MVEMFPLSFSDKLHDLTAELRSLGRVLKSEPSPDGSALREFRQALDNIRLTAWTVSEVLNAQQTYRNPRVVISFLTAERLRRFSQMAKDLSKDFERDGGTWPAQAVENLEDSLTQLLEQLRRVGDRGA
jgi:hypothetical protein